jgi:hypothetical protein
METFMLTKHAMKAGLAVVALGLTLGACGTQAEEEAPPPAPVAQAAPPAPVQDTREEDFSRSMQKP